MRGPKDHRKRSGGPKEKRAAPLVRSASSAGLSPVEFLEGELAEIESALSEAFGDGSWQAFATLKRQKRELFDALVAARAAAAKAETGPKLTDEQIVNQRLIPAISKLPLPLAWEVYRALGQRLGQVPAESADEVA
jgi:hypothetical protein